MSTDQTVQFEPFPLTEQRAANPSLLDRARDALAAGFNDQWAADMATLFAAADQVTIDAIVYGDPRDVGAQAADDAAVALEEHAAHVRPVWPDLADRFADWADYAERWARDENDGDLHERWTDHYRAAR